MSTEFTENTEKRLSLVPRLQLPEATITPPRRGREEDEDNDEESRGWGYKVRGEWGFQ